MIKFDDLEYTIQPNGCWDYNGNIDSNGYGRKHERIKGKFLVYYVHRLSYEHHNGPIKKGLLVRHKCDNRKCCNPEHLELGSHQDNMDDMVRRDRAAKGTMNGNSKLSNDDILNIRQSVESCRILGKKYGVSADCINKIKRRISWKHL